MRRDFVFALTLCVATGLYGWFVVDQTRKHHPIEAGRIVRRYYGDSLVSESWSGFTIDVRTDSMNGYDSTRIDTAVFLETGAFGFREYGRVPR